MVTPGTAMEGGLVDPEAGLRSCSKISFPV
jgi:hypothetical protein